MSSSDRDARPPLSDNTNSRTPSPNGETSAPNQSPNRRQLRRKPSINTLSPTRLDSSEDPPTERSSIYDALCVSSADTSDHNEKSKNDYANNNLTENTSPRTHSQTPDSTSPPVTPSRSSWVRQGGTPLYTIVEQKSIATLRNLSATRKTPGTSSESDLPGQIAPKKHKVVRQRSFSEDDKHRLKPVVDIENGGEEDTTPTINYTRPNLPVTAPPHRIETPPGLPSWRGEPSSVPPSRPSGGIFGWHWSFSDGFYRNTDIALRPNTNSSRSSIPRSHSAGNGFRAPRGRESRSVTSAYTGMTAVANHPYNREQKDPSTLLHERRSRAARNSRSATSTIRFDDETSRRRHGPTSPDARPGAANVPNNPPNNGSQSNAKRNGSSMRPNNNQDGSTTIPPSQGNVQPKSKGNAWDFLHCCKRCICFDCCA